MAVNPLVAALAAFGQGEAQGRERKRRAERDHASDLDMFRQRERQGALDRAAQEFQHFQMQAPERAEQQRVRLQGEAEARRLAEQERGAGILTRARGAVEAGRFDDPSIGEAMMVRPDLSDEFRKPKPAAPSAPLRGTPEYLKMLEGEEEVRARFRPPPRTAGPRPLPTAAIEKNIAIDEVDAMASRAQGGMATAHKAGKDVSGRLFGALPVPTWIRQTGVTGQGSDEAINAQNVLGNLVSTIGKMRSGGAITPQEFDRLEKFLPTDNDKEHVIALKLKNLRATLADIKAIRAKAYAGYQGGQMTVADAIDDEYGGVELIRPPE